MKAALASSDTLHQNFRISINQNTHEVSIRNGFPIRKDLHPQKGSDNVKKMLDDCVVIERQLGRLPRGLLGTEVHCPWGYPVVIRVTPLLKDGKELEPFPTLFWLTCPILVEQISRLEEQGWIKKLEEQIESDQDLRARYAEDHRRYAEERFSLLSEEDRAQIAERGWLGSLKDRGIAGIADFQSVKCLHAHYAHHLARGSVIGRWLEERFQFRWCPDVCCAQFTAP